uniref:Leptin receptor n=1 Tax=Junco hyemalis TaxID=40217 RepID=A0A8C5IUK8_JUNHY
MCWQIIPTVFVLMDFLQMAAAHCMVHPVPARNFTLPCVLLNETFLSPFSAGSWSGLGRELGAPKLKHFMNEENFLCCLWSASNFDCSLYRASMQARKFIPSEINLSAPQKIDWSWNVECWIRGRLDLLVCNLQLLKLDLRADLKVNLLYWGSELSLGAASTSSLQGTVRVAPCDCRDQASCQCLLGTPSLRHTYLLWLEVVAGDTALGSPLLALRPWDIVKPEAPVKLRLELAERGQVKLCWSSPAPLPFPLQHQVRVSAPPGRGGSQVRHRAFCGAGHARIPAFPNPDMDFNISCETDGYQTKMTCRWSANPTTLLLGSLQLRYHRSQIYCSDFPSPSPDSEVKECLLQGNHSYECTFQPIFLLSGYTLWIEFKHSLGTLQSSPTCVIPADVVKPLPPSSVGAEVSRNTGLLNVSWAQPVFASRDLTFQIRWKPGGREELPWQLLEAPEPACRWAAVPVPQPCAQYEVQVRCRELQGSRYWSDWSRAARSLVQDIRAPLRGPEFWRVVSEDPAGKQRNVTLLWKPLMQNDSLCSVSRYIIEHQTPGSPPWEEFVDHGTSWTFPWLEPTHTVTILAMNSLGISAINSNLTLSQQMSTVDAVQSLSAYLVNSTCVVVVWSLSPQIPAIKSFVIEWRNLNKEEQVKWLRVPPNLRKYFIYDHFILIEKYQFSLYPVFAGGVGKARATDQFAQGGFETGNAGSLHVVLPIVFSTSVLLLGALLLSHQRMKKLLWEDVPNPKNCSWAQGVNFQQPETLEHLFAKPPEPMSCEPLLLEAEMVLEDISITKTLGKEEPGGFLGTDSPQDSECDSACSSSPFQSSSFCRSCQHGAAVARGGLRYATVTSSCPSSGLRRPKSCPGSCLGSCFLGQHPKVLGGFCRGAWEAGRGAVLLHRALSLLSPQGLPGPLGEAERSLCYLGVAATDTGPGDSPTDSPGATGLPTERELLQHSPNRATELSQGGLKPKGAVPYVPQFRMAAAKGQEAAEKK